MKHQMTFARLGVILGALLLIFTASINAQSKTASSGAVTFTVTAVGKKESAPPIGKDDVELFQSKERKQIGDWKKGDQLYLAILIDDSIDTGAGNQWDYLKEFILAQPPATYIAVGYLRNNSTQIAQDFTQNHELAAKALRLPIFVVRNHKVSNGLGGNRGGVANLFAIGLALKLLRPLLLAGPFFLSLGKCCARACSHDP